MADSMKGLSQSECSICINILVRFYYSVTFFFFQAEDGIRDVHVTGVQTCALPIWRGMARGALVVILSDGWERGDPGLVAREMERLSRLAYRIVWVNPRVGASGFSPRAAGMAAALPHCDALVSGHSLEALEEVVEAIAAEHEQPPAYEREPEPEEETWASATPVQGSSVAMPTGYGPSRGKTTPGWRPRGSD